MKKRTLVLGGLLAASLTTHAASKDQAYLEANTGSNQPRNRELCLKVTTYSIASMMPNGLASSPIGVVVAADTDARDLVVSPDRQTGGCETGYISITTTAPLFSIRNAPVGL